MDAKQRVLAVAYDVFAEQGFTNSAMGTIADRLGITRPALYYHFASKEELFLAVYNTIDPIGENVTAGVLGSADAASFRAELRKMILSIVGNYSSDPKRAQFIIHVQHAGEYLPSVVEAANAQDKRLREALREALRRGVELRVFDRDFNLESGVNFLAVGIYGIGEVMLRGVSVESDQLIPFLFDGLFARRNRQPKIES